MLYRNDHDAALLRIEALERENTALAREVSQLKRVRSACMPSAPMPPAPMPAPPAPTPTLFTPPEAPPAQRSDSDPSDWAAVGLVLVFVFVVLAFCNV